MFFLSLLGFNCLELKIIHMSKWDLLGWPIVFPLEENDSYISEFGIRPQQVSFLGNSDQNCLSSGLVLHTVQEAGSCDDTCDCSSLPMSAEPCLLSPLSSAPAQCRRSEITTQIIQNLPVFQCQVQSFESRTQSLIDNFPV